MNENDTDPAPGKPFPKLFKHLSHYGGWPWLAASSTCFTMTKCKANLTPAIHSEAGIAAALAFQACYQGLLAETLRLLVLDPGIALSYICTMSPYGKGRAVYACIMSWPRRDRSGRSLTEAIRYCWLAPRWSSVRENPKEHSLLHSRILTVNISCAMRSWCAWRCTISGSRVCWQCLVQVVDGAHHCRCGGAAPLSSCVGRTPLQETKEAAETG